MKLAFRQKTFSGRNWNLPYTGWRVTDKNQIATENRRMTFPDVRSESNYGKDEPIDATHCAGKENCMGETGRCMTHELWTSLNQRMIDFLNSVSLQKLVDDQLAKGLLIEDKPTVKRAITSAPVVKPIRVNAPNSVFALGNGLIKG